MIAIPEHASGIAVVSTRAPSLIGWPQFVSETHESIRELAWVSSIIKLLIAEGVIVGLFGDN
ncbi:MAG: hypothetical protein DWI00_10940 [Planctomycetota bacterium]|nr:MAG: hypothetical protein DWI00_10940 [Planctomycetota bacterium]